MRIHFFFPLVFLILLSCTPETEKLSVNPESSPEVESLLAELYSFKGKYILSGQHNYPNTLNRSNDSILSITGMNPVIHGSDFGNKRDREKMIENCIAKYREGHIITLMYHQGCPVDSIPGDIHPVRYIMNETEWEDLVRPGSRFNDIWLKDIDSVAFWLKKLRDEGIPVLWRPYHEMNGIWFWWGNKRGEDGIIELWKQMYDRFTNYHGLNNLVWVWNANAPRDWKDDQAYAYELFYPGPGYVDILAADVYKGDYKQSHHDDLLSLADGKLIALGEIGVAPDTAIFSQQTEWSWFMMWATWPWRYNTPEQLKGLYNAESVINFKEYMKLTSSK